jgi:hypothetical protein
VFLTCPCLSFSLHSYKIEPTSKDLRGLEAVCCKLLDLRLAESNQNDPEGERDDVTVTLFREHLRDPSKYSDREIKVAVDIVNALRPFTPKGDSTNPVPRHVLATLPFVYLGNILIRAMGYSDFTKRICPVSSVGKLFAFTLNPIGICECLCAEDSGHFDVLDANGHVRSLVNGASKDSNRSAIIGAFFDLDKIDSICKRNGLIFADR